MKTPLPLPSSLGDDHYSDSDGGFSGSAYGDTGYDADDQHASSDSELVSHPSDNEDHLLRSTSPSPSPSPSPARSTTRNDRRHRDDNDESQDDDDGVDDSDDGETPQPSFTLSRHDQDLAHLVVPSAVHRQIIRRRSREQDDYFMVESSDLDGGNSSRPQSALSHNSEESGHSSHPGGPMHFIYPSMTLSPSPPPHLPRGTHVIQEFETTAPEVVVPPTPTSGTLPSSSSAQSPALAAMEDSLISSVSSSSTLTGSNLDVIKLQSSSALSSPQEGSASQEYAAPESTSSGRPHEPFSSYSPSTTHDIPPVESLPPTLKARTTSKTRVIAEPDIQHIDEIISVTSEELDRLLKNEITNADKNKSRVVSSSRTVQTLSESRSKSEEELSRIGSGDDEQEIRVVPPSTTPSATAATLMEKPPKKAAPRPLTPQQISAQRYTVTGSFDGVFTAETFRMIVFGIFILGSVLIAGFTTYLTYMSWIETSRTAHAEIASIRYAHDHRLAVAHLQIYTVNFQRRTGNSKPEEFHVRVLSDSKPWPLQEAPEHVTIFGEPIVRDFFNGTYIYVRSLYRPKRPQSSRTPLTLLKSEPSNPWACSDDAFYLHVWFANGTRISGDAAPEIFTTKGQRLGKPLYCLTTGTGTTDWKAADPESGDEEDEGEEADYIRYWRQKWQDVSDTATKAKTNMLDFTRQVNWIEIQKSVSEVPYLVEQALMYVRQSVMSWTEYLFQWTRAFLFESGAIFKDDNSDILTRVQTIFERARENAKRTKEVTSSGFKDFADRVQSHFPGANIPPQVGTHPFEHTAQVFKEQIHQVQKVMQEKADLFSTRNVLQVADDIFLEAEAGVDALWESKAAKKLAKAVHADDFKKQAKKMTRAAEDGFETVMQSKFVRSANDLWLQGVDDFQSTTVGGAATKKAKEIKKDVRRRWRRLQRDVVMGI